MVSIIILTFVVILAVILIGVAWGYGARRRAGQSGTENKTLQDTPKVGRAPGPD